MKVILADVSAFSFIEQLTALSIQGLANRESARLFLDFGIYDDPAARKTNEDFLPENIWQEKFRPFIGRQDHENLAYYQTKFDLDVNTTNSLEEIIRTFRNEISGMVVWDPGLEDTLNIAMMLAGLENLLVVAPQQLAWAEQTFGLSITHDLRQRWYNRVSLYTWALENLYPRCKAGRIACIEPGWQRPEFYDMVVKECLFTYSLSSKFPPGLGGQLLFLILGGPTWLRNLLFDLRLDRPIKRLGLRIMSKQSAEFRLACRIQRNAAAHPQATIFGWHTRRDDEFSFMVLLSANGLRLIPSHMASNFSFHGSLPGPQHFEQPHCDTQEIMLEEDKTYLTFTLSDGDQLMMMSTAELGNWRRPERGKVPFNWEVQPLLVEFAPALYEQFAGSLSQTDLLVAGPSGAGYIIPPLHDDLPAYLAESAKVCRQAGIRVVTSYYPDPPRRVIRQHLEADAWFLGFLSGYFYMKDKPAVCMQGRSFVCNAWPPVNQIDVCSEDVLAGVRQLLEQPGPAPRFIGVHLFAYRTTISDIYAFVQTLDPQKIKVVRGDEFLIAASQALCLKESTK